MRLTWEPVGSGTSSINLVILIVKKLWEHQETRLREHKETLPGIPVYWDPKPNPDVCTMRRHIRFGR